MKEETVEVIELWMPSDKGEAYHVGKGPMKIVARLVNGYPIILEKDWMIDKYIISKQQADEIIINSRP